MPRSAVALRNSANALRQAEKFWTDARVDTLRTLAGQKLCAARIANELGGGCTKDMVISKCRREGIALTGYATQIDDIRDHRHRQKVERLRGRIADLLGQLIALRQQEPRRVSRETSGTGA